MAKKLLFLGGGRSNIGAIQTAKQMDIVCYVAGIAGDYPCNKFADKLIDVNIFDKYATYDAVKDLEIDGVLICCSDKALETCGFLCDKLKLQGITEASAIISSNKYEMKKALIEGGVNTAKYVKITCREDLKVAAETLVFPLMVKAVDLQGSKGVYRANNLQDLYIYYEYVCNESSSEYCIVEECIIGEEMGAQAFVYKGKVLFVQPHGDIISNFGATSAPTGHYTPINLLNDTISIIEEHAKKAIKALGFDNCAVNMDFIIRNGIPYFIELTGRVGANCLPELMSYHFGFNYYQMIVATAVGQSPIPFYNPSIVIDKYTVTKMIVATQNGIIKTITQPQIALPYVRMFVKNGDAIHTYRCANDCIGEALFQSFNLQDAINKLEEYNNALTIEI